VHGIVKENMALFTEGSLTMLEPEYRLGATTMTAEPPVLEEPSSSVGSVSDRIESLIERYPWPTLLLALGLGYFLSRRVR
jgi:hypothetical protein